MKNYLRILGIVMAASLFGVVSNVSAAEPTPDWQDNMGAGMMGGYGPEYGMGHGMTGWGIVHELDLSRDQKAKFTQIRHDIRTKQLAVMGQMMDAQDKLQELYDADKQDSAAIKKQYKVIEELRLQMMDNSVDAHNQINSILTKEQREKFQQRGGRGYGPMMHGH